MGGPPLGFMQHKLPSLNTKSTEIINHYVGKQFDFTCSSICFTIRTTSLLVYRNAHNPLIIFAIFAIVWKQIA
jgi:hypothetical protein